MELPREKIKAIPLQILARSLSSLQTADKWMISSIKLLVHFRVSRISLALWMIRETISLVSLVSTRFQVQVSTDHLLFAIYITYYSDPYICRGEARLLRTFHISGSPSKGKFCHADTNL